MADFLELQGISKRYGAIRAAENVSFGVKQGEFFSFLGPSGCGKTTLLRIIAGFEKPDSGRIIVGGKDITDLPPHERPVKTIFQNYALFPHLSIWENIAFGLRLAKRPKAEIETEVERMLELIQMKEHAWKKPHQISGGQKQRVAIARALVTKPQVLLLDEPLAALDLKLRQRLAVELDLLHDEAGITFIFVTHDQTEAMSLSDRIAVMNKGLLQQIGSPAQIYESPQTSFVAAFIGDTNFMSGTIGAQVDNERCRVAVDGLGEVICFNDHTKKAGEKSHLIVRPERFHISLAKPSVPDPVKCNLFEGVAEDVVYSGNHTRYMVRIGELRVSVYEQHCRYLLDEKPIKWNDKVWLWWHADDSYMIPQFDPKDTELVFRPPQAIRQEHAHV